MESGNEKKIMGICKVNLHWVSYSVKVCIWNCEWLLSAANSFLPQTCSTPTDHHGLTMCGESKSSAKNLAVCVCCHDYRCPSATWMKQTNQHNLSVFAGKPIHSTEFWTWQGSIPIFCLISTAHLWITLPRKLCHPHIIVPYLKKKKEQSRFDFDLTLPECYLTRFSNLYVSKISGSAKMNKREMNAHD